jgi:hypothetical protein
VAKRDPRVVEFGRVMAALDGFAQAMLALHHPAFILLPSGNRVLWRI